MVMGSTNVYDAGFLSCFFDTASVFARAVGMRQDSSRWVGMGVYAKACGSNEWEIKTKNRDE